MEPYREICNLNLLLESQGEEKKTEDRAGHDERACLGGVRRRLVSVIPSCSVPKDCPTHRGFLGPHQDLPKTACFSAHEKKSGRAFEHNSQDMVPIQLAHPSMRFPPVCKDFDTECPEATARGACKTAAEFMLTNCRLSCEICSTAEMALARKTPLVLSSKMTRECNRLIVGSSAVKGRIRGHRRYCSERYSEDLECQGRSFGFSRVERGRDSWDIIERDLDSGFNSMANVGQNEDEPRVVFQGPVVYQASHNAAFLCNGDGTLTTYGGRIKAASRFDTTNYSQIFYRAHFPGLQRTVGKIGSDGSVAWSSPELVLDEQKARTLLCLDMRPGVEVCEFNGKLSATNYRGNTYLFGRANMAKLKDNFEEESFGGRHVQFSRHPIDDPNSLEPFSSLHFEDYSINNENNIYFMAVMSLRDEMMVGLMPAIIDGQSGIFLSHSETGVLWSKPQLIMESEAVGQRTRDFPVDGFFVEDYRLVFSVEHDIYLEHDDMCDAPPFVCSYELTGSSWLELIGRASPVEPRERPVPQETSTAADTGSCQHGILHELEASHQAATGGGAFACCPASCGKCSGGGCEKRPGGMSHCCAYMLVAANETCRDSTSVACIVPSGQAKSAPSSAPSNAPSTAPLHCTFHCTPSTAPLHCTPPLHPPTLQDENLVRVAAHFGLALRRLPGGQAETRVMPTKVEELKAGELKIEPAFKTSPQETSTAADTGSCQHGILHELEASYQAATGGGAFACCPASCGKCSGGGCEKRPGGMSHCCAYGLVEANETCRDSMSVACIVPGSFCRQPGASTLSLCYPPESAPWSL